MQFSIDNAKIWVPGANGMVGSALLRRLKKENVEVLATTRNDLDLRDTNEVNLFYKNARPDLVILAAAKVGGIHANNTYPADFIGDNLQIQNNVIVRAKKHGVKKLLFLGSSCSYPKNCSQPIKEEYLLNGPLEPTNEWYAIAKIAGIKLCQAYRKQYECDFISAMPTNLYGPMDSFHPEDSHVPAALLSRFHDACKKEQKSVTVWGTGKPLREFLHVDDLADACVFLLKNYSDAPALNIGTGEDISIGDFAKLIKTTVGFSGDIEFDTSRPDGTFRKRLDVSKIHALGWRHRIDLESGLKLYYQWYLEGMMK
ncbi:GDP-L-fucose synthetase [Olavius algarvensis spirochete endosymbiont]|uniref:GDP-L-fucose synthase family protein n=1 Tax=Olavius algarvensis spirochete endosymbiont TaxID=260710 RepID=UPI000F1953AC|nr:GDP-L-fucose synthase [Olavius algarvensis spirochete endosymbiont]CAD7845694.1 MAG: GDP-L-fucose synthetase (EC 1.1.1.271) [Olavius algarvensis spirochete endosymbiont]VDB00193.1 GDP-L-fucose synthetase [Olavius algarvensis spirochete endosymbiont]